MNNHVVDLSEKIEKDIVKMLNNEKILYSAMEKVLENTFHSLDVKQIIFNNEFLAKNQKIEFTKVDNDYVLSY
jgi:hypothetical protein